MKFSNFILYYNTLKHLKGIQIRYQLLMRIRQCFKVNIDPDQHASSASLKLHQWIDKPLSFSGTSFCFLNQELALTDENNPWYFKGYGKLWSYNLHYMDYLLQADMTKERGLLLIEDYIKHVSPESPGLEPYPISLRGINWIKFCTKHDLRSSVIDNTLYSHYQILSKKLEFHLLGNHLLENAFSLLYGGLYFGSPNFFNRAKNILEEELKTQILSDGGHFERSPMYHQILLDRLLDCINLLQNNTVFKDEQPALLTVMQVNARNMLNWLNAMTFENGEIPMLNDSAPAIAPPTRELNNYATGLKLVSEPFTNGKFHLALNDSGYRRFNSSLYECIVDVGEIGPDFQPGHAHADTLSFVLQHRHQPFIVDTGVSTYEKNERRSCERGTSSHNTVQFEDKDSSEVWGGFRVGRRARILSLQENNSRIIARHDGYKHYGFIHERAFQFTENRIEITDENAAKGGLKLTARIHLHPDVKCTPEGNRIDCEGIQLEFTGHSSLKIAEFMFAAQFNRLIPSRMIEITFDKQLKTIISFKPQ